MLPQNKQLLDAAESGQLNLVKQAIQGGADINAADEHGSTALMLAAIFGYPDVVKFLIGVKQMLI
ncbi:ankyrin repeat domain-containing protein [Wolbachia endosymbiont of Kerria lacca]|uniref:ankyrin repeat domain-containing protein n=1 Tax=Wolbachia endosymbiont of Kerria lacca TaxID=427705 RepID=UPI003F6731DA